ncbi:unnamed protein product, partial [Ceratitis capitata]
IRQNTCQTLEIGEQIEETQSDTAQSEAGAVSKCSSFQDNGQTPNVLADEVIPSTRELEEQLLRMGSNSEGLMLSYFEEHTGKDSFIYWICYNISQTISVHILRTKFQT